MHFPLRDRTLVGSSLRIGLGVFVGLSLGFSTLKFTTDLFEAPEACVVSIPTARTLRPPPRIIPTVYADVNTSVAYIDPTRDLFAPIPTSVSLPPAPTLKPGQEIYEGRVGRWIDVIATAYSPRDPIDGEYHATKGKWRWKTADGKTDVRTEPYGIAVPLARDSKGRKLNRPWYRFGTEIIIPTGYGYLDRKRATQRVFEVDDVGNGKEYFATKHGKLHIDLRFIDHDSAIQWAGPKGYREIRVFIVED